MGSSYQLGVFFRSSIGGGLEGVTNGLLMPSIGISCTQNVYGTKKG